LESKCARVVFPAPMFPSIVMNVYFISSSGL
jgi:hypothetical protein